MLHDRGAFSVVTAETYSSAESLPFHVRKPLRAATTLRARAGKAPRQGREGSAKREVSGNPGKSLADEPLELDLQDPELSDSLQSTAMFRSNAPGP